MSDEYIKKKDILKFIEDIKCNKDVTKNYGTLLDIMRYIRKMPTYDVDSIIKHLEENAKYFQSEADELAQKGDWGTATDLQGRATAYKDAVEIVKSGGVADE